MPTKLPRCFFTLTIDGMPLGTLVFELCADICPKTCENFMCLCTGERGRGSQGKLLTYKGSGFHRIVKDFMIQGGDFTHGTGVGGESIYGGVFPDENFILKHDEKYLLSMANRGPNTNGSQFFITTAVCPHLDNSHVVFGHLVEGDLLVVQIERTAVDADHKPFADIRITDCGLVDGFGKEPTSPGIDGVPAPLNPPVATVAPSSIPAKTDPTAEEAVELKKEDKKKKKKKKKKASDSDSSDSDSSESSESSGGESSESDGGNNKLKKKKKKLIRIKKKLDKMAKKKKLKKSRAKKLKRVEMKIKKIDKIISGEKLTSEEDSEKEETKSSFLYRNSASPPKKKIKKEKLDKVLDEDFFAKRGKIKGTLLAPISSLHGMGVEEYSQTGPTDRITSIVNRSKTNVGPGVGGLEKAKKLGVSNVLVPQLNENPEDEKEKKRKPSKVKETKKKKSKKEESSGKSSDSDDKSSDKEVKRKSKKAKKKTVEEVPRKDSGSESSEQDIRQPKATKSKPDKKPQRKVTPKKAAPKKRSPKRRSSSSSSSSSSSRSRSRSRRRDSRRSRSREGRKSKTSSRSHHRSRRRSHSRSSRSSSASSGHRYSGVAKSRGRGRGRPWRSRGRGFMRSDYNTSSYNKSYNEKKWEKTSSTGWKRRSSPRDSTSRRADSDKESRSKNRTSRKEVVEKKASPPKSAQKNRNILVNESTVKSSSNKNTGLRSKWSDDDAVKIEDDKVTRDFENIVKSESKGDQLLTGYTSPKLAFS